MQVCIHVLFAREPHVFLFGRKERRHKRELFEHFKIAKDTPKRRQKYSRSDISNSDNRQVRSLESQAFSAAFDAVSQKCRFEYVRGDDGLAHDETSNEQKPEAAREEMEDV